MPIRGSLINGLYEGNLIADAHGDLFGTTAGGGANGAGTVFEIAKTAAGYASTPITLVSFNGAYSIDPGGLPRAHMCTLSLGGRHEV